MQGVTFEYHSHWPSISKANNGMIILLTMANPAKRVELLMEDFSFDLLIMSTCNSYCTSVGAAILKWAEHAAH